MAMSLMDCTGGTKQAQQRVGGTNRDEKETGCCQTKPLILTLPGAGLAPKEDAGKKERGAGLLRPNSRRRLGSLTFIPGLPPAKTLRHFASPRLEHPPPRSSASSTEKRPRVARLGKKKKMIDFPVNRKGGGLWSVNVRYKSSEGKGGGGSARRRGGANAGEDGGAGKGLGSETPRVEVVDRLACGPGSSSATTTATTGTARRARNPQLGRHWRGARLFAKGGWSWSLCRTVAMCEFSSSAEVVSDAEIVRGRVVSHRANSFT